MKTKIALFILFFLLIKISQAISADSIAKILSKNDSLEVVRLNKLIAEGKIPDFEVKAYKGKLFQSKNFKGKVVVLHFWRYDCPPCRSEIPSLNQIAKEFENQEVLFLGFTSDSILKTTFAYNIIPAAKKIIDLYGIRGVPTDIILSKEGKVIAVLTGGNTYKKSVEEKQQKLKYIINEALKTENLENIKPNVPFTLNNIYFDFGKAELLPESFSELNKLINYLKEHKENKILIIGHTDNVGEQSNNLKLSEERAKAVGNYLISKGIQSTRIETKGMGSNRPLESNETEGGRQKNRRVEMLIK